jgi:tetratricopeptide (TPR) repeat protein
MANIFAEKQRNVIPGWRSLKETGHAGELGGFRRWALSTDSDEHLILRRDWAERKNLGRAADILAASVHLLVDQDLVAEARAEVLRAGDEAPAFIIQLAETREDDVVRASLQLHAPQDIFSKARTRVQSLRRALSENPRNGILWCELALEYSVLGSSNKAGRAMEKAVYLTKHNRYVIRSAARYFLHVDDEERSHDLIRKSDLVKYDPWVGASEIAIATLRKRQSRFTKHWMDVIRKGGIRSTETTELATAIGTVEWAHGSLKGAKSFLKQGLMDPNDNSLAQVQWISQQDSSIRLELTDPSVTVGFSETLAKDAFIGERFDESLAHALDWHRSLPFAERPIFMGTHIASVFTKEYDKSIELAKEGLRSNPKSSAMWNNLAYAAALAGNLDEAAHAINMGRQFMATPRDKACIEATSGLLAFRRGDTETGRVEYEKAIDIAAEVKEEGLEELAKVNMLREQARIGIVPIESDSTRWLEEKSMDKNLSVRAIALEALRLLKREVQ